MSRKSGVNWRKIWSNINLIAIAVGICLFFAQIKLPSVLGDAVSSLSSMIGPISMVMIGMLLASVEWKSIFIQKRIYLIVFLKMIVFPGIILLFLRFLGQSVSVANAQTILLISLLAVITPSATTVTQLAQLYDRNAPYASAINVFTTIVCIVTMPLMVMLYTL